ncbi:trans-sialidase [Trypanosoma rangeli]|uniref:Trans-sialidase n=1 Tax=Trypanosoma rangeli TaxID=5698 RepID=A0A3R7M949_TRYRA|nr:trans-sialidase [Trypanosoma rangeli]RNE98407.1 trans-sialidase [Trypanosoma rangeli]|eukprot:RNE98407.1 trans-sialidase [Trypanosoma rangeli]
MLRQLFSSTVLLLLCLLPIWCSGSGAAANDQRGVLNPFTGTKIVTGAKWEKAGGSVTSLRVPSLLEVDGAVFAVAEAQCKKNESGAECITGIASKRLDNVGGVTAEALTADASSFDIKTLKGGETGSAKAVDIMRPTTLVDDKDIYMLLGKYSRTTAAGKDASNKHWGLLLVKGRVTSDSNEKKIQWNETYAVNTASLGLHSSWTKLFTGGGSGVVLQDGTLVFPMQATEKNGKNILLSMRFSQSENKWKLSHQATENDGCRNPSIAEWEGYQKLLMMAPCEDGYYDVYTGLGAGRSWRDGAPITRVWGTSLDRQEDGVRSGFITATIKDKKVVLLTTPVYSKEEKGKEKGRLHLWVTDNTRVHDVGPVSSEKHDAAASSLLYRKKEKEELILLYENKNEEDSYSLVSVRLTDKLKRIKEVVKTWEDMDTALEGCTSTGIVDPLRRKNVCKGPVTTEGLVGFLSNTLTDGTDAGKVWKDEYLGVNATVKGETVTSTEGGVTFKGAGAGAEWPVGKLGQNQPYYFANNELTLVAMVMINAVPEADTPLMGVRMNDNASTVLVGLFYTKDKKWGVTVNGKPRKLLDKVGTWRPGTTYQVVLKMNRDDEFSVYVDGANIYDSDDEEEDTVSKNVEALFKSHRISHFYFGGGSAAEGTATSHDVTMFSVLLYNEALSIKDIWEGNANTVPLPQLGATTPVIMPKVPPTSGGDGEENALVTKPASAGDNATEKQMPNPEAVVGSGSSPAPRSDAEKTPAEETRDTLPSGTVQIPFEKNEGVSQGADNAPVNKTASPEPQAIPPTRNAASLSGNVSVTFRNITGVRLDEGNNDSAVRGCVPHVLLLALIGLWGIAALYVA